MSADRNLLFGILAVQLDFVTRDALIDAMNAWLLDKAKPLDDILRDRGVLSAEESQHLSALVAVHLKRHANDARQSLAALPPVEPALRKNLATITDAGVLHSLAHVTGSGFDRAANDGTGTLLQPTLAVNSVRPVTPSAGPRYRIVRPHAKGGLGEVFVAEDTELGRQVALKEIQDRFADDGTSRSRFVLEAEITGGLEHPGIVPVYGLGTYSDGRPFYAMRLIKGDNLLDAIKRFHDPASGVASTPHDSADEHGALTRPRSPDFRSLEFRDLLRRFLDVCNAVAYAHSRGVLHRDLKPGNVMLGQFGETLVVDWGLAKVTGRAGSVSDRSGDPTLMPRSAQEASSATVAGQALGTPAYMSPEQADGRHGDLAPATDVYSLGATLYEVLTGRTAFHGLPALVDVLSRVAAGDFPPPRAVQPAVPPALEAVCLKAMALRPAARYASATDLARDLERWLADAPVTAYREPLGARMRRWVRRHARLVTGLAAALAVGAAALGGLAWQRELARRAVASESGRKDLALAQVERVNEILGSVFKDLDPTATANDGKPLQAVLGERLDRATAAIEGEVLGDPLAVARMQLTLGESQYGLGYPEKAIRLLAQARTTFSTRLGPDHADTLASLGNLALSYKAAGQLDRAVPLLEETLRLRKAKLGPDHVDTLTSMNSLAGGYRLAGQLDRAVPLYEETFRLTKAKLGPDHPDTLARMGNLALGYWSAGHLDRALPLFEETVRLCQAKLGPDHLDTIASLNNLAAGYQSADRFDSALPLFEEAHRLTKAKLGPEHPDTLTSLGNLALGYWSAGQFDRAVPLFEETVRLRKAKQGPEHPDTLTSMNNLASGYRSAGQFDRAVPLYEETFRLTKAKLGPDHPSTLLSMGNLALAYWSAGQLDRAVPLHEEAIRLMRAKLGPDHPITLASLGNLALGYQTSGQFDRALPLHEEALKLRKAKFGPDHPDTLTNMTNLALGYQAAGRFDAAEPLVLEVADAVRRKSGAASSRYAAALANLGSLRIAQKNWAEAEQLLRTALAIQREDQPDAWTTFGIQSMLGGSLLGQQKPADAEPLLLAGFAGLKQRANKIPRADKAYVPDAAARLVQLYDALGKPDEAAKYRKELEALKTPPAK